MADDTSTSAAASSSSATPPRRPLPSWVSRWRRVAQRFSVDWLTYIGASQARVKDYSASGMYLELDGKTPVGSVIEFVIDVEDEGRILKMTCAGEVARIVEKDGKIGLGIRFTRPLTINGATGDGSDLWWRRL